MPLGGGKEKDKHAPKQPAYLSIQIKAVKGVPTEHFGEVCCRIQCGAIQGETTFKKCNAGNTPSWSYSDGGFIFDLAQCRIPDDYPLLGKQQHTPGQVELQVWGRSTRGTVDLLGFTETTAALGKGRTETLRCPLISSSPPQPSLGTPPPPPPAPTKEKEKEKKVWLAGFGGLPGGGGGGGGGDDASSNAGDLAIHCDLLLMTEEGYATFSSSDKRKGLARVSVNSMYLPGYGLRPSDQLTGGSSEMGTPASVLPQNLTGLLLRASRASPLTFADANRRSLATTTASRDDLEALKYNSPMEIACANRDVLRGLVGRVEMLNTECSSLSGMVSTVEEDVAVLKTVAEDHQESMDATREEALSALSDVRKTVEHLTVRQKVLEADKEKMAEDVKKVVARLHAVDHVTRKLQECVAAHQKRGESESLSLHEEVRALSRQLDDTDKRTLSTASKVDFVEDEVNRQTSKIQASQQKGSPRLVSHLALALSYVVKGLYAPIFLIVETLAALSLISLILSLTGLKEASHDDARKESTSAGGTAAGAAGAAGGTGGGGGGGGGGSAAPTSASSNDGSGPGLSPHTDALSPLDSLASPRVLTRQSFSSLGMGGGGGGLGGAAGMDVAAAAGGGRFLHGRSSSGVSPVSDTAVRRSSKYLRSAVAAAGVDELGYLSDGSEAESQMTGKPVGGTCLLDSLDQHMGLRQRR
eukprot:Rhum_TRINITY_DN15065_c4_g1::Rhum_TRINITY_DN15065_c4_g1_i1::g.137242::m.137242